MTLSFLIWPSDTTKHREPYNAQRNNAQHCAGNILFYILIAVALLGLLTAAMGRGGSMFQNLEREDALIKANQIQRYGAELEQAVRSILSNATSETDIRFAHPSAQAAYGSIATTPTYQIFSSQGGSAEYRSLPTGVSTTNTYWEFMAHTNIERVGSDKAELVAIAPDISLTICERINKTLGLTTMPVDSGAGAPACIFNTGSRFTGTFQDSSPNSIAAAQFTKTPALQACVQCASDSKYYYYTVLMAR